MHSFKTAVRFSEEMNLGAFSLAIGFLAGWEAPNGLHGRVQWGSQRPLGINLSDLVPVEERTVMCVSGILSLLLVSIQASQQ